MSLQSFAFAPFATTNMAAVGDEGTATFACEEGRLATAVGSGSVRVFGTPSLVAVMEAAACNALEGWLP